MEVHDETLKPSPAIDLYAIHIHFGFAGNSDTDFKIANRLPNCECEECGLAQGFGRSF